MAVEMIGQRYGRWICLAKAPGTDRWRCRCDCGSERVVLGRNVRSGASKSCGCLAREMASAGLDMSGQRFGRLMAIKRTVNTSSGWRWLFRCDCGQEHEAFGSHVRYGRTRSCGCLASESSSRALKRVLERRRASEPLLVDRLIAGTDYDEAYPDCLVWDGDLNNKGYGVMSIGGNSRLVHRVSHEIFIGPIPHGLVVMHSCDNRPCWSPHHLSAGTCADNTADMVRKGRGTPRKSHCDRGHPYDEANTRVAYGRRYCRACGRERDRRRRAVGAA